MITAAPCPLPEYNILIGTVLNHRIEGKFVRQKEDAMQQLEFKCCMETTRSQHRQTPLS